MDYNSLLRVDDSRFYTRWKYKRRNSCGHSTRCCVFNCMWNIASIGEQVRRDDQGL